MVATQSLVLISLALPQRKAGVLLEEEKHFDASSLRFGPTQRNHRHLGPDTDPPGVAQAAKATTYVYDQFAWPSNGCELQNR